MGPWHRRALFLLFTMTGFSALALQVVWQRVISIHGGVDLASTATVVSAFMAGLGAGNLIGGWLADRLGPRRALLAFAGSNAGIGIFGLFSVALFYDGYRSLAGSIHGTLGAFAFHFGLLVVPTTLMGLSLPLLSRGVVRSHLDAAAVVGRLYAVNTLGAAAGAAICGWWMLGNLGFVGTVRVASSLNLVAAVAVFLLWRASAAEAGQLPEAAPAPAPLGPEWRWFALYGLTGAAALGLEVVFFRVVDAIMRSNSYTFAHVLTLYLLLFGGGAAFGARWARTAKDPGRRFLWIQLWIGATSLAGVLLLVNMPATFGMRKLLEAYFATDGYLFGPEMPSGSRAVTRLVFAHLTGPLLVMGAPVFLMGAAYPHVMAVVSRNLETLGRRTGLLMTCNVAGNVLGSLVTGFVLLDVLGTSGTLRLLGAVLMALGVPAAVMAAGPVTPRRRAVLAGVGVAVAVVLMAAFPANERLWGFLHSAGPDRFVVVEERSCVNALVRHGREEVLYLNATSQNGYPYDDFHVLIGLAPALVHPWPARGMSVGLGIGSTAYAMLQDRRMERVDSVEICGGERDLLAILTERGARESRQLLEDGRHQLRVGDGRKHLLLAAEPYDVIVVDALRPNSAYSGNVYSVEFYELVASRLGRRGLFAQWIPTGRVLPSAARAFPHVASMVVPGANGSFMLASGEPIELDRAAVVERIGALAGTGAFSEAQQASLTRFFQTVELQHFRRGEPRPELDGAPLNQDLHPRDEYFLNEG